MWPNLTFLTRREEDPPILQETQPVTFFGWGGGH